MENSDSFSKYHPIVNMIYFCIVLLISMFSMHPVIICISLAMSVVYSVYLKGIRKVVMGFRYLILMSLMIIIINPLFNHEGMTIIRYFKSGNPLTLESIIYGVFMAILMLAVINWFGIYNIIMTSDKFIYLFGRIIPHLSLVISMALRYVPRFTEHFKQVRGARKCIGKDISQGNIIIRLKNLVAILSIMITWSLENSVETADSMKSRGYGLPGRTAFSIYRFHKRDGIVLAVIGILSTVFTAGIVKGKMYYRYFPTFEKKLSGCVPMIMYLIFIIICSMPLIIDLRENRKYVMSSV